ncbi:Copia type Polyprotein [Phytophthora megakarya]|uniref:Copia type Polyprotein n=1 Tax=Phytophthora megakarya TaxID=4795 RepID=A0A225WKA6_9STRA|nr:Copia type Polyprotein [Phytophthora megakarya]
MDAEMAALKAKGVLRQIPHSKLPGGQQTIKSISTRIYCEVPTTRCSSWRQAAFDISFTDTFSPVVSMATFWTFVAVSNMPSLEIYQGDINTAYLNAAIGIKQYL